MENNMQNNNQPITEGQEQRQAKRKKIWKRVWKTALVIVAATVVTGTTLFLYERMRWYDYETISENVLVQTRDLPDEYRIYNTQTGRVTVKHVSHYSYDEDNETALVRFLGGKDGESTGYFDRLTGEAVIAPEYELGWDMSDGIVAVMDYDRQLHFFKADGKPLHTKSFPYNNKTNCVQYHGGHCAVCDTTGRWGLINTAGQWVIEPCHTLTEAETEGWNGEWLGVWRLTEPDGVSIADSNGRIILVSDNDSQIIVESEGTIIVTCKETPAMVYDLRGRLLYRQAYYTVSQLYYEGEYTSQERADALEYTLWDGRVGLMDLDGHPLTEAVYSEITALNTGLFKASIYGSAAEVVLNAKGKVVE